jgi:hypothetical protein
VKRAAWLVLALAPALAAQTVTVTGTVTNAITHEPIGGVAVRLWSTADMEDASTDAAGAFRIAKVAPGKYRTMLSVREPPRAGPLLTGAPTVRVEPNSSA